MASVLSPNELKKGVVFVADGKTWQVLDYKHIKMGRTPAVVKVKVKDLEGGVITEKSFQGGDTVEEGNVAKRTAQYLYREGNSIFFMDSEDFSQFGLESGVVEDILSYLKEGQKVVALFLDDRPVSVEIPKAVELEVMEAPDGVAGDSASNPTKAVVLETGLEINVPLFIKKGEVLKINTDTGAYVSRA